MSGRRRECVVKMPSVNRALEGSQEQGGRGGRAPHYFEGRQPFKRRLFNQNDMQSGCVAQMPGNRVSAPPIFENFLGGGPPELPRPGKYPPGPPKKMMACPPTHTERRLRAWRQRCGAIFLIREPMIQNNRVHEVTHVLTMSTAALFLSRWN